MRQNIQVGKFYDIHFSHNNNNSNNNNTNNNNKY